MRAINAVLVAAALALGVGLGINGKAEASQDQCPDGSLCAWEGPNFSGGFFVHAPLSSIGNFGAYRVDGRFVEARRYDNGHGVDNSISSLWNRTSLFANLWPAAWWMPDPDEGCQLRIPPGGAASDLARDSGPFGSSGCANDVFSSFVLTDY
jgi:Peptidase inhibitor family I36